MPFKPQAVKQVSTAPEGSPAHPSRSPHRIVLQFALLLLAVIAAAAIFGAFFGLPGAIIAVLLIVSSAVVFNPEAWSTKPRLEQAADRSDIDASDEQSSSTTASTH